jgi:hypothetical protein
MPTSSYRFRVRAHRVAQFSLVTHHPIPISSIPNVGSLYINGFNFETANQVFSPETPSFVSDVYRELALNMTRPLAPVQQHKRAIQEARARTAHLWSDKTLDPESFFRNTGTGNFAPMSAARYRKAQSELSGLDAILPKDAPSKAQLQKQRTSRLKAFAKRQQFFRDLCSSDRSDNLVAPDFNLASAVRKAATNNPRNLFFSSREQSDALTGSQLHAMTTDAARKYNGLLKSKKTFPEEALDVNDSGSFASPLSESDRQPPLAWEEEASKLNVDQRSIFELVFRAVLDTNSPKLRLIVNGGPGTGKTAL